jgi:hypothetical protein
MKYAVDFVVFFNENMQIKLILIKIIILKSSLNHWAELYQTKIAPFMTNIDFFSK